MVENTPPQRFLDQSEVDEFCKLNVEETYVGSIRMDNLNPSRGF